MFAAADVNGINEEINNNNNGNNNRLSHHGFNSNLLNIVRNMLTHILHCYSTYCKRNKRQDCVICNYCGSLTKTNARSSINFNQKCSLLVNAFGMRGAMPVRMQYTFD